MLVMGRSCSRIGSDGAAQFGRAQSRREDYCSCKLDHIFTNHNYVSTIYRVS